jgi:hypothetical protein
MIRSLAIACFSLFLASLATIFYPRAIIAMVVLFSALPRNVRFPAIVGTASTIDLLGSQPFLSAIVVAIVLDAILMGMEKLFLQNSSLRALIAFVGGLVFLSLLTFFRLIVIALGRAEPVSLLTFLGSTIASSFPMLLLGFFLAFATVIMRERFLSYRL